jgi:hypothetical protein
VELRRAGATVATCTAEVRVVHSFEAGARGDGRTAFHAFLNRFETEPTGYGQYSYVLFSATPKDAGQKDLYKAILSSLLQQVPATAELAKYLEPARLNGLFVPVRDAPIPNVNADWLLEHYDYTRASALLSRVPGARPSGIYLVSGFVPLLSPQAKGPYLVQDLSGIPLNLVSTWVRTFVNQAAQVRFWEPSSAAELVLRLRLSLSVLAVGVPQIQEAVKNWISTHG